MKWPWNCFSWNALKEKFHSVSFPLQQKCKIKGGTRVWRLRNMCLAWHSYKFRTYFSSLSILWKKNCLEKMWGVYSPLSPPPPRCRRAWKDNRNCYKVGYFVRKWPISRVNICKIINSWNAKHSKYFKTSKPLFITVFPICMIKPLIETDMEKQ